MASIHQGFSSHLYYIQDIDNIFPDALSCHLIKALVEVDFIPFDVISDYNAKVFSIELDNKSLLECFLHHPHLLEEIVFPLDYQLLYYQQLQDLMDMFSNYLIPECVSSIQDCGTEVDFVF